MSAARQPRAGDGDLARHRMDRIRRGRQQVADHQIAFGDPRALIEQPRGLVERLEIEFDQRGAERCPALQRLAIGFLRGAVAEEDQLAVARHAEPEFSGKRGHRPQRPVARKRIGAVRSRHRRQRGHRVVDGEREHRNAVQRPARRHQAGVGDQPEARLQSNDVVEHRGHAARARGVGAERQRHEACGNRDRRSRTRSARNQIGADRIDGDAVGRADADQAGCELVEIGLADDDGAGRAQSCDRRRILRGRIGEGRAGRRGRQAQRVDIVLHRDRHAVQRKRCGILRGQRLGLRQRLLLVAQADEDGGIVVVADALIAARDGLRRASAVAARCAATIAATVSGAVRPHGEQNSSEQRFTGNEASDVPLCTIGRTEPASKDSHVISVV